MIRQVLRYLFSFEFSLVILLMAGEFKLLPVFSSIARLIDITVLAFIINAAAGAKVLAARWRRTSSPLEPAGRWRNVTGVLFLVFVSYMLLSSVARPTSALANDKATEVALVLPWFAFVGLFVVTTPVRIHRLMVLVMAMAVVLSSALLMRLQSGDISMLGAGGFGDNYQRIGRLTGASVVASVIYLAAVKSRSRSILLLIVAAVSSVGMIYSGHRAGLLMAGIVLVAMIPVVLYSGRTGAQRARSGKYIISLLAIVAVVGALVSSTERAQVLLRRYQAVELSSERNPRLQMYEVGLELFSEHPVMGIGLGRFKEESGLGYPHPHNLLVEVLAELGLIGFAMFGLLYLLPAASAFVGGANRDPVGMMVVSLYLFYFLNAMVSGGINDNRELLIFAMILVSRNEVELVDSGGYEPSHSTLWPAITPRYPLHR